MEPLCLSNTKKHTSLKRVGIGGEGRHFRVVRVLPALPVKRRSGGQHGVAVLLQELPNQAPGLLEERRALSASTLSCCHEEKAGIGSGKEQGQEGKIVL